MKKKLLLFGASVATAMGSALLVLTLASATALANVEGTTSGSKCETKQSNGDCGHDCPSDKPKCHILKSNDCGCEK